MISIQVMHQDYGPFISPATHQRIIQVSWDGFIKLTAGWNIFHELPHPTLSFSPIMSSVMSPFPSTGAVQRRPGGSFSLCAQIIRCTWILRCTPQAVPRCSTVRRYSAVYPDPPLFTTPVLLPPSPSIYCGDGVREAEMKLAPQFSLAGLH